MRNVDVNGQFESLHSVILVCTRVAAYHNFWFLNSRSLGEQLVASFVEICDLSIPLVRKRIEDCYCVNASSSFGGEPDKIIHSLEWFAAFHKLFEGCIVICLLRTSQNNNHI